VTDPAHQSLGWCLWQVPVTPSDPCQGYDKGVGGSPNSWPIALPGVGASKNKSSPVSGLNGILINMDESLNGLLDNGVNGTGAFGEGALGILETDYLKEKEMKDLFSRE